MAGGDSGRGRSTAAMEDANGRCGGQSRQCLMAAAMHDSDMVAEDCGD